jgi:hypothetical protein
VDSAARSQQGGNKKIKKRKKKKQGKRQRVRTLASESTEGEDVVGTVAPAPPA